MLRIEDTLQTNKQTHMQTNRLCSIRVTCGKKNVPATRPLTLNALHATANNDKYHKQFHPGASVGPNQGQFRLSALGEAG